MVEVARVRVVRVRVARWLFAFCLVLAWSGAQGEDMRERVEGNTRFALGLYQVLWSEGNLFFSPHSLSLALATLYAGAAGETERQIAAALHFSLAADRLHPASAALNAELQSRGEGARGRDGEGFRLKVANALWGQQGYSFLEAFLATLAEHYGAGLRELDFQGAPEEARKEINRWTGQETEGRVEELLPPGMVSPLTRLVLTNAVYFNAAWRTPFEERLTEDAPFTLLDGSEVSVPTMHAREPFGYAEGDGFELLELAYDGGELGMVVFLPAAGSFRSFEAGLTPERLEAALAALGVQELELFLPSFTTRSSFSLAGALRRLGMVDAFAPGRADFSGMTGDRELFVHDVVHEAFVVVDEAGTEAAAATAIEMRAVSAPLEPLVVRVDRPFVYLIRDVKTGTVLFMGRVLDPRG